MGLFTWIKALGRRGSNPPAPGNKPAAPAEQPLAAQLILYRAWKDQQTQVAFFESSVRPCGGAGGPVTPKPPIKPQPTGGRLIYVDRDPGPVPPRLPDDLADLPVLTAAHLDGIASSGEKSMAPDLGTPTRMSGWLNFAK